MEYQTINQYLIRFKIGAYMELIAIVTPTYNRANLLNNLYQSLVNQTSNNFKWYIVDDGSTDNTEELCNNFIQQNKIEIEFYIIVHDLGRIWQNWQKSSIDLVGKIWYNRNCKNT